MARYRPIKRNLRQKKNIGNQYVTRSIMVILVKHFQTELMVEIYSKSLVRTIGKLLLMKLSYNTIKVMENNL